MDRQTVHTLLGDADVHRDSEKVWVYGWGQSHGQQVVIGPGGAGGNAPLYPSHHVFIVEFDDSGRVLRYTVAKLDDGGRGPSCTPQGLCVEAEWTTKIHDRVPVSSRLDEAATRVYRNLGSDGSSVETLSYSTPPQTMKTNAKPSVLSARMD